MISISEIKLAVPRKDIYWIHFKHIRILRLKARNLYKEDRKLQIGCTLLKVHCMRFEVEYR